MAQRGRHGEDVAAVVAAEHRRAERDVLGHAARQVDAEDGALAAGKDVGLQAQSLSRRVASLPLLAHGDDGQRDLVAQLRGVGGEVAVEEERIAAALAHHLDVGRAQAQRIDARQKFAGATARHWHRDRRAIDAQRGEAVAKEWPGQHGLRQVGCGCHEEVITPPSGAIACPVMSRALSETRKSASPARSSISVKCCMGMRAARSARYSSVAMPRSAAVASA